MISIIICTYNRQDILQKTLAEFSLQSASENDYEIVLINNNSPDDTEAVCSDFTGKHPAIHFNYIMEMNQGLSYARNRGVKEAKGEILVFLDDDAFIMKDYVKNLKAFFQTHPDAMLAGGRIFPYFESERPQWMSRFLLSITSSIDKGNQICLFKGRSYPIGANMIFKRKIFDDFGLFDVQLGRRGDNMEAAEEKDLFLRVKKAGIPIYYLPDVSVRHWVPDKRLTDEYFSRQAYGIGYSEKVRANNISSMEYLKSCGREIFKWGATFILFLAYALCFQFSKACKLVEFRWKISQGLFPSEKGRERLR